MYSYYKYAIISIFFTFKIIVGKGENAGNQHFLPFPQCFLTYLHMVCEQGLNSLPNDKILDGSKFKTCADVYSYHKYVIISIFYLSISYHDWQPYLLTI